MSRLSVDCDRRDPNLPEEKSSPQPAYRVVIPSTIVESKLEEETAEVNDEINGDHITFAPVDRQSILDYLKSGTLEYDQEDDGESDEVAALEACLPSSRGGESVVPQVNKLEFLTRDNDRPTLKRCPVNAEREEASCVKDAAAGPGTRPQQTWFQLIRSKIEGLFY